MEAHLLNEEITELRGLVRHWHYRFLDLELLLIKEGYHLDYLEDDQLSLTRVDGQPLNAEISRLLKDAFDAIIHNRLQVEPECQAAGCGCTQSVAQRALTLLNRLWS